MLPRIGFRHSVVARTTPNPAISPPAHIKHTPNEAQSRSDERFMQLALAQAHAAATFQEVPVGAVLVAADGSVLAATHNQVQTDKNPVAHAELLCITEAAR